jgi:hypothetical protein
MKRTQFFLGLALIFIGLGVGEGEKYLEMRQLEMQFPSVASPGCFLPSDASGTYQLLKSNNEFAKSFSPEIYADLMRDYSSMDNVFKREFQDIHNSISKKKSDASRTTITFFYLASLNLLICFLLIRKSQSKQANFVPMTS